MLILLILLLLLLRQILRNFGGDFTFALILITMFFVKLHMNRSTTDTIDDFSDIHKSCQPKKRRIDYKSDSDSEEYNYYHEQNKHYTALEFQCLELQRAKLEYDFYFQRLWTYTMLALFFIVFAVCVPYAIVYSWREYHHPERVLGSEHGIMRFIVAVTVIAVAAHQL